MRIGHGFDVHKLIVGRKCLIGGVEIAFDKGLDGHSDADVLLHAICDALLGAASLGDIGKHFPPSDNAYKNANSRDLLRHVIQLLKAQNYSVNNIDATVICEAPKLSPYTAKMCENIAADCHVAISQINIKATTTEKLGFTGRGEGIAAEAVCTIVAN
jgi:2-C-methyl-D-erythritol 2,4-cyclodiphosphate synthase